MLFKTQEAIRDIGKAQTQVEPTTPEQDEAWYDLLMESGSVLFYWSPGNAITTQKFKGENQ